MKYGKIHFETKPLFFKKKKQIRVRKCYAHTAPCTQTRFVSLPAGPSAPPASRTERGGEPRRPELRRRRAPGGAVSTVVLSMTRRSDLARKGRGRMSRAVPPMAMAATAALRNGGEPTPARAERKEERGGFTAQRRARRERKGREEGVGASAAAEPSAAANGGGGALARVSENGEGS
jgi:hypothetical protein